MMSPKQFAEALREASGSRGAPSQSDLGRRFVEQSAYENMPKAGSLLDAVTIAIAAGFDPQVVAGVLGDDAEVLGKVDAVQLEKFGMKPSEAEQARRAVDGAVPVMNEDGSVKGFVDVQNPAVTLTNQEARDAGVTATPAPATPPSGGGDVSDVGAELDAQLGGDGEFTFGDAAEGKYLGVPDGFRAGNEDLRDLPPDRIDGRGATRHVPGVGEPSAIYEPQHAAVPNGWSSRKVVELQKLLIDTGLLDPGQVILGLWDKTVQDAYSVLLSYANRTGIHNGNAEQIPYNAAFHLKNTGLAGQKDQAEELFERRVWREPSGDELAQSVKAHMRQKLGRDPKAHELAQLQAQFAAAQRSEFEGEEALREEQFTAQQGGQPVPVGGLPNAQASFSEWFETKYQPEFDRVESVAQAGNRRQGLLGSMMQMDRLIGGN